MLFAHLFKLAQQGPMVMSISVDAASGRMTVNVMPNVGKNPADAALRTPLTLTGTPEEFDAGFFKLLEGYRESRKSLAEQAEATREVIDAAKDAQVAKAAKASAAKTKARAPRRRSRMRSRETWPTNSTLLRAAARTRASSGPAPAMTSRACGSVAKAPATRSRRLYGTRRDAAK